MLRAVSSRWHTPWQIHGVSHTTMPRRSAAASAHCALLIVRRSPCTCQVAAGCRQVPHSCPSPKLAALCSSHARARHVTSMQMRFSASSSSGKASKAPETPLRYIKSASITGGTTLLPGTPVESKSLKRVSGIDRFKVLVDGEPRGPFACVNISPCIPPGGTEVGLPHIGQQHPICS